VVFVADTCDGNICTILKEKRDARILSIDDLTNKAIYFTLPAYAQYLTIVSIYPYTYFGLLIAILRGSQY
jgi:hypothetical protein